MAELSEAKQRAKMVWAAGDYPSTAELIGELGRSTVKRAGVSEGDEVLDVACGAGNATIPAAQTGARVTGLDLVPELLEAGREQAVEAGVEIEWVEGDAENLPFEDESFDVVLSTVGAMFAPDHAAAARELARVARSGGRVAVASWTPDGSVGQFFQTMAKHMPPPPEGFQPPVLWGVEEHIREIFDGTGLEIECEQAELTFRFPSAEEAAELYETKFGPVLTAKAMLEPEGKWEAVSADLRDLFDDFDESDGDGIEYPGQYLLVLGKKG